MSFQRLHESLRSAGEPNRIIRVGSSFPVAVPESVFLSMTFTDPARNLAEAQKDGVKPVNFTDLLHQFSETQLKNSVLFDSAPSGPIPGNHWRILELNTENNALTLQLCGPLGNYDEAFPPTTVSQYDILFTGMSTPNYQIDKRPVSLQQLLQKIAKAGEYSANIKYIGRTIYWSNKQGILIGQETIKH